MDGYIYIIECIKMSKNDLGEKFFYTGMTARDPNIRFTEHVHGINSQWMCNNNIRPRRLIYVELLKDCSLTDLLYREQQVKRMSHKTKGELI